MQAHSQGEHGHEYEVRQARHQFAVARALQDGGEGCRQIALGQSRFVPWYPTSRRRHSIDRKRRLVKCETRDTVRAERCLQGDQRA